MSAPDTSMERQKRRHLPSLMAIGASVLFGLIVGFAIAWTAIDRADAPTETAPADTSGASGQ